MSELLEILDVKNTTVVGFIIKIENVFGAHLINVSI